MIFMRSRNARPQDSRSTLIQYQDFSHARSNIKNGESGVCVIKWRTDARDSPNLTLERA